jgi:hypothetical protein
MGVMHRAALGVADDREAAAELRQHGRGDLARVRAPLVLRAILRAPAHVAAGQRDRHLAEVREGYAHRHVARERTRGQDAREQFGVGRVRPVHLPVAGDQFLAHGLFSY